MISSDPYVLTLRVIRSLAKLGTTEIPPDLLQEIQSALKGRLRPQDKFQIMRNLVKLLSDPLAAEQLLMLWRVGYFEELAPSLEALISEVGLEGLRHLLKTEVPLPPLQRSSEDSVQKWLALAAALPEGAGLIQLLSLVEPAAALRLLPRFLLKG